jgi:hypothetical protein
MTAPAGRQQGSGWRRGILHLYTQNNSSRCELRLNFTTYAIVLPALVAWCLKMHVVVLPRAAAAGVLAVAALLQQLHSSQLHPPTHMLVLYALRGSHSHMHRGPQ